MKTLNITLSIMAETHAEADLYGKCALMEFAKAVGMRSGSTVASCEGETEYIAGRQYNVNAEMQIDGNINVNETIQEAQQNWNNNPRIFSSTIFVSDEQKPEPVQKPRDYEPVTCAACGQVMVKGYETVINNGTDNEYCLCNCCCEESHEEGEIGTCCNCDFWIDMEDLVENPVTHKKNICPVCGGIYNDY